MKAITLATAPPNNTQDSGNDPVAQVTITPAPKPGKYTFSLVVTDNDTKQDSPVATFDVEIRDRPVAKISTVGGAKIFALNQPISLTADGSTTGPSMKYTWSLKSSG